MSVFKLVSDMTPSGDQPEAIRQLTEGLKRGDRYQTLLGVTGSGKTFTISNVIAQLDKPVLIMSHNKTLAAQLYSEFKGFFPHDRVEFFISYYDYYQPEAYVPSTDTYIAKDASINDEIDRLRLRATSALLSGDKKRDRGGIGQLHLRHRCPGGVGQSDRRHPQRRTDRTERPAAEIAEHLLHTQRFRIRTGHHARAR